MKNLKNIIRKNLNLISEEETIQNIDAQLKAKLGDDYTRILNIATEIYNAFKGGILGGTNVEDLISAIKQINNPSDFSNVDWVYSTYFKSQYPDIATGLSKELEINGSRGRADNLEDFETIQSHLKSKGVTVSGGWDGKIEKQVPIKITVPNTETDLTKKTNNSEKDKSKSEKQNQNSNTQKLVINNDIKDIQTMISKTPYKNLLPTKRSSTGIDGYWGKRTSQALLSLLNDYENKTKNSSNFTFSNLTKKDF